MGGSVNLQEVVDDECVRAYNDPDNKLRASILADPPSLAAPPAQHPCTFVGRHGARNRSTSMLRPSGGSENKSQFR